MKNGFIAVIFDMDGVIFDSERLSYLEWVALGKTYGIEDIDDVYRRVIGVSRPAAKRVFLDVYGEDFPYDRFRDEASARFREKYGDGRLPLKPGVRELLTYLKENGYRVALASSTQKETVVRELGDAALLPFFHAIVTGDRVERSKPAPDIFLAAAKMLGAAPKNICVIEDSPNGIRAAHAAGMIPVMVPDMIEPDDEMREKAWRICPSLDDVRPLL